MTDKAKEEGLQDNIPDLAMAGDDGKILTVTPSWCRWYENTFGAPKGSGFTKGKEIINQVMAASAQVHMSQRADAIMKVFNSSQPIFKVERAEGGLFNNSNSVKWTSTSGEPAPEGYNVTPPEMEPGHTYKRSSIITAFDTVLHVAHDEQGEDAFYVCAKDGQLMISSNQQGTTMTGVRPETTKPPVRKPKEPGRKRK